MGRSRRGQAKPRGAKSRRPCRRAARRRRSRSGAARGSLFVGAAPHLGRGDGRRHRRRRHRPDRVDGDGRLGRVVLAPVDEDPAPAQRSCACWRPRGPGGRTPACGRSRGCGPATLSHVVFGPTAAYSCRPFDPLVLANDSSPVPGELVRDVAGHHAALDDGRALAGVEIEDHVVRVAPGACGAARRATGARGARSPRGWPPRPSVGRSFTMA